MTSIHYINLNQMGGADTAQENETPEEQENATPLERATRSRDEWRAAAEKADEDYRESAKKLKELQSKIEEITKKSEDARNAVKLNEEAKQIKDYLYYVHAYHNKHKVKEALKEDTNLKTLVPASNCDNMMVYHVKIPNLSIDKSKEKKFAKSRTGLIKLQKAIKAKNQLKKKLKQKKGESEEIEVDDLPQGWEAYRTKDQEVFYYNTVNGTSQWEKPTGPTVASAPAPAPTPTSTPTSASAVV